MICKPRAGIMVCGRVATRSANAVCFVLLFVERDTTH